MMRKAYMGMNALFALGFHGLLTGCELLGWFPFSRTFFFPMLLLPPLLMAIVGWYERDRVKWPSMAATAITSLLMIGWVVLLVLRLRGVL